MAEDSSRTRCPGRSGAPKCSASTHRIQARPPYLCEPGAGRRVLRKCCCAGAFSSTYLHVQRGKLGFSADPVVGFSGGLSMRFRIALGVICAVALAAVPSWAHHSHGNYVDTFTDITGIVKEVHLVV